MGIVMSSYRSSTLVLAPLYVIHASLPWNVQQINSNASRAFRFLNLLFSSVKLIRFILNEFCVVSIESVAV